MFNGNNKEKKLKATEAVLAIKILKALGALGAGAAVIITLSFSCLLGVTIYETFFKIPDEITVPNITGKHLKESLEFIQKFRLNSKVHKKYSNDVPAGTIISQEPQAGDRVRSGREIEIVSSLGPELIGVPDISGMTRREGEKELTKRKLVPGKITYVTSSDEMESIIEQTPKAGDRVKKGTPVSFKINEGKIVQYELPIFENRDIADVMTELKNTPFKTGKIRWIFHDYIEYGKIIRQSPLPGTFAAKDYPVNLDVSAGKAQGDLFIKQDKISFIVPDEINSSTRKSIKITLRDKRGLNTIYSADHVSGDFIELLVTTSGAGEVNIYSNSKLKKKITI